MTVENTRIVLAGRPKGKPVAENFRIEKEPLPKLDKGQVLIKVIYLSLDPYMRGRMSKEKSYADPVPIGGVMTGETAGLVIKSKSLRFAEGDYVCCAVRMAILVCRKRKRPDNLPRRPLAGPALSLPRRLRHAGPDRLFRAATGGKPRAGETLLVSAASGAVGSVVGQTRENGTVCGL